MQIMHWLAAAEEEEEEQQQQRGGLITPRRRSFRRKKIKKNGSVISSPSPSVPVPLLLIVDSFSRKSFSYDKLPQEPLKLTVIKLDGTSFQIEMVKTGTVAQLKRAIEMVFSHLPRNGPRSVSWSFVWGHFCLYYDGQKLLNDIDEIGSYGIKDGDELYFIRHVSICYNMVKERSEKEEDLDLVEPPTSSSDDKQHLEDQEEVRKYCQKDIENQQEVYIQNEDTQLAATNCRQKLANLFRGWFSYRKLPTTSDVVRTEEHKNNSSRFSFSRLGSYKDQLI